MSRLKQTVEVNNFNGGLNTEASILNFPLNASRDERNMVLNRDNSRQRRLGFNFEKNHTPISVSNYQPSIRPNVVTYNWINPTNITNKNFVFVVVGSSIRIFDLSITPLSDGVIYSESLPITSYSTSVSVTNISGDLVFVNGQQDIILYSYNVTSNTIEKQNLGSIKVRDIFGVQSFDTDGNELTDVSFIDFRPETNDITETHIYNLRNQTWARRRLASNSETLTDPIKHFNDDSSGFWPAHTDTVNQSLFADPEDSGDRISERFFARRVLNNPRGKVYPPRGYFVIDLLKRGTSRLQEITRLQSIENLDHLVSSLPLDETPFGATVVEQFAGRVWYTGFSSQVLNGDKLSPKLGNYLVFSREVRGVEDLTQCYQEADPTSHEQSDLIDTDGGVIQISGAVNIKKLAVQKNTLFVFADNGVWEISGDSSEFFSPISYNINKLTDKNCVAIESVVIVDDVIFYWSDDGINVIKQNDQYDSWESVSVTDLNIKTYYNSIPENVKKYVHGEYDKYNKKISWVFVNEIVPSNTNNSNVTTTELIYDLNFQCFILNDIKAGYRNSPSFETATHAVVSVFKGNLINSRTEQENVTVFNSLVTVGGADVTSGKEVQSDFTTELNYLVIENANVTTNTISYGFGNYSDDSFYDWGSSTYPEINQTDPLAYIITGPVMGGTQRLKKQIPYLTASFEVTEQGYEGDTSKPSDPSSCLFQSRWDWTDSNRSGRWSRVRDLYRPVIRKPETIPRTEPFPGSTIFTCRERVRGNGRSVSFLFQTKPGHNLHMYGWAFDLTSTGQD